MDLAELHGGSFINWETVSGSWSKRTVASRQLIFSARRYLEAAGSPEPAPERMEIVGSTKLPAEIQSAFASPPEPGDPSDRAWGEFLDAAVAAELEMVSYGERPPLLHELRNGLEAAAEEAGPRTALGRWFLARRDALPGTDLPEDSSYLPV